MLRRRFIIVPVVLLLGCLAVLPACKKKKSDDTGKSGGTDPTPVVPHTPSGETGGYLAFVQFKAKDILDSALFKEVKDAFAKSGGTAMWDELEGKVAQETGGVKPTDIDTVTIYVTDISKQESMPKVVVIVNSNKAFDKNALVSKIGPQVKADAGGFYGVGGPGKGLLHFPDDKTLVFLHPDLAQSYLNGYAKNRNNWPVSADLSKAAAGHMLYATVNLTKLPPDLVKGPEAREFGPLLTARTVSVSVDLKGKEIILAVRASFPDAAKAGEAKATVQKFVDMGVGFIDNILKGKGPPELAQFSSAMPAIQEAQRALKDAKIAVSGSDLTIAGSYKIDFDLGKMAMEATKQFVDSSEKMIGRNNMLQIGLALHNFHSAVGTMPIHAVGAKAMPLKNQTDKPLLSCASRSCLTSNRMRSTDNSSSTSRGTRRTTRPSSRRCRRSMHRPSRVSRVTRTCRWSSGRTRSSPSACGFPHRSRTARRTPSRSPRPSSRSSGPSPTT